MSAASSVYAGLFWKETRQIVPLVAMLAGTTFLVLLLWTFAGPEAQRMIHLRGDYLLFLMPGLFAAGAGAILVGQEKETRTLWWNAAMPIDPAAMIGCKLAIALAGLGAIWLIAFSLLLMLPFDVGNSVPLASTDVARWVSYTLFLLATGFFTAWRFQSAFTSLLMLVPIALLPGIITTLTSNHYRRLTGQNYLVDEKALPLDLVIHLSMFGLMLWLVFRAGQKTLGPANEEPFGLALSDYKPRLPKPAVQEEASFRIPFSALVWQTFHQNLIAWLFLASLVVAGAAALAVFSRIHFDRYDLLPHFLSVVALAGGSGISWLGVAAFAGDGSSKRMRFLADRGVSPTLAWLTRHAAAASFFALVLFLYGLSTLFTESSDKPLGDTMPVLSLATLTLVVFVIYGVSQWVSQTIRIVSANFVLAPVVSGIVLLWLGFAATDLRASLPWLLTCASLPYFATWLVMRWHMDDQGPLRMMFAGLVTLTLLVVLPLVPSAYTVITWPRVSSSRIAALQVESQKLGIQQAAEPMLLKSKADINLVEAPRTRADIDEYLRTLHRRPQDLLAIGIRDADAATPLGISSDILQTAINRASLVTIQFKHASDDAEAKALLSEWIHSLTIITKRLRRSDSWDDQEAADFVEIWLVQTLAQDPIAELRNESPFKETAAMLVDVDNRNQARRRAVLTRWKRLQELAVSDKQHSSVVYDPKSLQLDMPPALRSYLAKAASDRLTVLALDMLDADAAGRPTDEYRKAIHELVSSSRIAYDVGPYSDRIRVNDLNKAIDLMQTIQYPANQWFAGWEEIPKTWSSQPGNSTAHNKHLPEVEYASK